MNEQTGGGRRVLVVSAHAADFVWRAGGAIARATTTGGAALVVLLSYGERGESGELWNSPGQTIDAVKAIRRLEAERAAAALGAHLDCFDLGDYPLRVNEEAIMRLTDTIARFQPDVILTHTDRDPFNPDHPTASAATEQARLLSSGAGVASAFATIRPPALLWFEPHQPELCGFMPTVFLDITDVFDQKRAAMEAMVAQTYLRQYYTERAEHRANHARRICGRSNIRYAEAFQRQLPEVVNTL